VSLKSLIKKTINSEIAKDNGIAETISYRQSGKNPLDIKAIVEYPQFNQKKDDIVEDTIVFHGLDLGFTPKQADVIVYDNTRYVVGSFKTVVGLYDVTATKSIARRGKI